MTDENPPVQGSSEGANVSSRRVGDFYPPVGPQRADGVEVHGDPWPPIGGVHNLSLPINLPIMHSIAMSDRPDPFAMMAQEETLREKAKENEPRFAPKAPPQRQKLWRRVLAELLGVR